MRLRLTMVILLLATTVSTACDRSVQPPEASVGDVHSPRGGAGDPVGERASALEARRSSEVRPADGASPERTYDGAIIRIAEEHEGATDRCDAFPPLPRVDCKAAADRQREASGTRARKQRDLARR